VPIHVAAQDVEDGEPVGHLAAVLQRGPLHRGAVVELEPNGIGNDDHRRLLLFEEPADSLCQRAGSMLASWLPRRTRYNRHRRRF
jgi:hypothetical protein